MFKVGRAPPRPDKSRRPKKNVSKTKFNLNLIHPFGKSWLLIPFSLLTPYQRIILNSIPQNYKDLFASTTDLESYYSEQSKDYVYLRAFYKSELSFSEIQTQIQQAFEQNQRLRLAFKRLLNLWRAKHIELVNSVDIVTQEPIQKPVSIIDWNLRKQYQFEASTILQDSTLRIMNHDALMMESLFPRNILTNTNFTESQCISLYYQMKKYGITNHTWECFAKSGFSLKKLLYTHEVPMRLEIMEKLFKTYTWDSADLIVDFIDLQYRELNEVVPDESFIFYSLKKHWENPYVKGWVYLCRMYWAAQIRPHAYTDALKSHLNCESRKMLQSKTSWYTLSTARK
jgi:hypothetical protein